MRRFLPLFLLPFLTLPAIAKAEPPNLPPPGASGSASTQADPPPPPTATASSAPAASSTPATQPKPPAADAESWQYRYRLARDRLLAGDFTAAAQEFNRLALETDEPIDKAVALNQAQLALEWARRRVVFVKQTVIGESPITAKAANERTSDELGVLYVNSVLYGIGTGGWAATVGEASSAASVILPMLLFSGAAAGTVALLDSGRPLHYGVPQSIVSGLYIGLEEGFTWAMWNQSQRSSKQLDAKGAVSLVWGLSTVGAIGGGILGSNLGTTPGRASWVNSVALWTGAVAGSLAAAATPDRSFGSFGFDEGDTRGQNGWAAAAVGMTVGTVAGLLSASAVSPSIARVRYLDLGGLAGGLAVGGLYLAAADKNASPQAGFGALAIGMAAGLTISWFATDRMAPDRVEEHEPAKHETASLHRGLTWSPSILPAPSGVMIGVQGGM